MDKLLETNCKKFEIYLNLLLKWNRTYNLTSITDSNIIWEKHFLDSVLAIPFLPKNGRLLDIGTGAGFPGIPIKITNPRLSVVLVEATQKKCNFCETVIRELSLHDINVINGRIEKLQEIIGKFDIIISRAVFSLKELIKYGAPYLRGSKAKLIAIKGTNIKKEACEAKEILDKYDLSITSANKYKYGNIIVISNS